MEAEALGSVELTTGGLVALAGSQLQWPGSFHSEMNVRIYEA